MSRKTTLVIALTVVMLGGMVVSGFAWQVNLRWDDPDNNPALVGGYNLYYRRPALGEITYIIPPINVGNNLTFLIASMQNGFEYCFVVTAYERDTPDESDYSNELCASQRPAASIEQPVAESTVFGTQLVQVRVVDLDDPDGSHTVTLDINNSGNWALLFYNTITRLYEIHWDTSAILGQLSSRLVELAAIALDPAGFASNPALTRVTVVAPFIHTLFSPSSTPTLSASTDGNAVELGVRFTSDANASVIGIRFYKGATNIGPHTGNLWTNSDGQLLGTVLFTGETSNGWQEASFANPIPITANTVYVASYHTASGNYAFDENYFALPLDNSPLHALGVINGVYQYGAGGFPSSTYNASNYWVDVVTVDRADAAEEMPKLTLFSPSSTPTCPQAPTATRLNWEYALLLISQARLSAYASIKDLPT